MYAMPVYTAANCKNDDANMTKPEETSSFYSNIPLPSLRLLCTSLPTSSFSASSAAVVCVYMYLFAYLIFYSNHSRTILILNYLQHPHVRLLFVLTNSSRHSYCYIFLHPHRNERRKKRSSLIAASTAIYLICHIR